MLKVLAEETWVQLCLVEAGNTTAWIVCMPGNVHWCHFVDLDEICLYRQLDNIFNE